MVQIIELVEIEYVIILIHTVENQCCLFFIIVVRQYDDNKRIRNHTGETNLKLDTFICKKKTYIENSNRNYQLREKKKNKERQKEEK